MIRYHTTWTLACQIVMCWGLINTSCRQPSVRPESYADFYFPIDEMPENGMRYTYRNLRDTIGDFEIWEYRKTGEGSMEAINFDHEGEVVQHQYDRVISNGVVTDSLLLFYADSTGARRKTKVRIHSPHRFPFEPGDSTQQWLTHLEWWQPEDSLHVVLQRRRSYAGDTLWTWQGKSYPAVRLKTRDTFETERDGWTESAWTGEEWYAQSLGLVYYRRDISPQLVLEFGLTAREEK